MGAGNAEIVRSNFEAIRSRDVDALLRLYHPDGVFRPLTGTRIESGGYRGHDGIRAYFDEVDEVWDQMTPYADDLRTHGDVVVAIGGCKVRGRESGAESDSPMAWVFRIREGRILSTHAFSDAGDALADAGMAPDAR